MPTTAAKTRLKVSPEERRSHREKRHAKLIEEALKLKAEAGALYDTADGKLAKLMSKRGGRVRPKVRIGELIPLSVNGWQARFVDNYNGKNGPKLAAYRPACVKLYEIEVVDANGKVVKNPFRAENKNADED